MAVFLWIFLQICSVDKERIDDDFKPALMIANLRHLHVFILGNDIMVQILISDFAQQMVEIITSSVCFAEVLHHCIILYQLSTTYIKPTVHSIRYFSCQYNLVAFSFDYNWPLILSINFKKCHRQKCFTYEILQHSFSVTTITIKL